MGQDNVGSMVVFQDGLPKKAHYRKFAIRGQEGMDDFAAMAEVISRRFARLAQGATADEYDESFAATPNLVVVDGGKGQLAAALAAMQAFDLPRVAVIALAKRSEEVFVPGQREADRPLAAQPGAPAPAADPRRGAPLRLGFHRQRRESRGFASLFDELEGVGPARRRALLQPLRLGRRDARGDAGGARGRAGRAGEDGARSIYAQLHKTGGGAAGV